MELLTRINETDILKQSLDDKSSDDKSGAKISWIDDDRERRLQAHQILVIG
jgi:hypothetical protein